MQHLMINRDFHRNGNQLQRGSEWFIVNTSKHPFIFQRCFTESLQATISPSNARFLILSECTCDPISPLCYTQSYSKRLNICGLTKAMTELISVAKYSSNDRPHTGREGEREGRARRIREKSKSNRVTWLHDNTTTRTWKQPQCTTKNELISRLFKYSVICSPTDYELRLTMCKQSTNTEEKGWGVLFLTNQGRPERKIYYTSNPRNF